MPSPFPGIDPYVEAKGPWHDFHVTYLVYTSDLLNRVLPEEYVSMIEVPEQETFRAVNPVPDELETEAVDKVREKWIEIRKLPHLELITVIELLSLCDKVGSGRVEYLEKRRSLLEQPIHLVELDFLLGGHRLPMRKPLPKGNAYAIVARKERRPDADVYAWSLRDPLPVIPIPLSAPDPDVMLDLASAFSMAYDRGRYSRILRYDGPLMVPLDPEESPWVEERAKAGRII